MSVNLVDVCQYLYPGEIEKGNITFRAPQGTILFDNWSVPDVEKPDEFNLMNLDAETEKAAYVNKLSIDYAGRLEYHIEQKAIDKGYKDSTRLATYTNSAIEQWKSEADQFIIWRDSCWQYAYNIQQQVLNDEIEAPTLEEFEANIPTLTWS